MAKHSFINKRKDYIESDNPYVKFSNVKTMLSTIVPTTHIRGGATGKELSQRRKKAKLSRKQRRSN